VQCDYLLVLWSADANYRSRRCRRKLSATEKAAFECYIKFCWTNGQVVDTGKKAPIVDDADYANRRAAARKQRKRGQDLLQECLNLINDGKYCM
jgi:hypothetical protein